MTANGSCMYVWKDSEGIADETLISYAWKRMRSYLIFLREIMKWQYYWWGSTTANEQVSFETRYGCILIQLRV